MEKSDLYALALAQERELMEERLERAAEALDFLKDGKTRTKPLALELLQRMRQAERELVRRYPAGEDPPKAGLDVELFRALRATASTLRAIRWALAREMAISRKASRLGMDDQARQGERLLESLGAFKTGKTTPWCIHVREAAYFRRSHKLHGLKGERIKTGIIKLILSKHYDTALSMLKRYNLHGLFTVRQARQMEEDMERREKALCESLMQEEDGDDGSQVA